MIFKDDSLSPSQGQVTGLCNAPIDGGVECNVPVTG